MDFKSTIATSMPQSKRLLDLGLKPETGDMVYHHSNSRVKQLEWELETKPPTLRGKFWTPERITKLKSPFHKHPDGTLMTGEEIFDSIWGQDVPAWSVGRLFELMPDQISCLKEVEVNQWQLSFPEHEHKSINDGKEIYGVFVVREQELIEACVEMLEWLTQNNYLNKELLKI